MTLRTTWMFGFVAALVLAVATCVPRRTGGGSGDGDPSDTAVGDATEEPDGTSGIDIDSGVQYDDGYFVRRDADAGSDGIPLQDLATPFAESYCSVLFRCCDQEERTPVGGGDLQIDASSESTCTSEFADILNQFVVPSWSAGVSEGRLAYDPQAAKACLDAFDSADCSAFPAGDAVGSGQGDCEDIIEPQVELGGTCKLDAECKEGRCATGESETGTCEALLSEGETCEGGVCEDGLYCESWNNACQQKKSVGEQCSGDRECTSSICELGDGTSEVCKSKKSGGETCTRDEACASGYCDRSDSESGEGTCLAEPVCDGA